MTAIVNFFSGPSTGKSMNSAALFAEFKRRGINAELVTEFAKDCVWEDRLPTLDDQIYIFGKQHHRIHRLIDKVDVIVTDSPLLLSTVYNNVSDERGKALDVLVMAVFRRMNNINFFINRSQSYQVEGRTQTEAEAREVDAVILDLLRTHEVPYTVVDPSADTRGIPGLADKVLELVNGQYRV